MARFKGVLTKKNFKRNCDEAGPKFWWKGFSKQRAIAIKTSCTIAGFFFEIFEKHCNSYQISQFLLQRTHFYPLPFVDTFIK